MKTLTMRNLFSLLIIIITLVACEKLSSVFSSPSKSKPTTSPAAAASNCTSAVLDVPRISQQRSKWCWAASMEMAMKYHIASSKAQYQLVQDYIKVSDGSIVTNCNSGCPFNPLDPTNSMCNRAIGTFQPNIPQSPSYYQWFNVLFLYNDWISVEDPDLSWEKIKFEINNCRPLILIRDTISKPLGSVYHAVTAKGYIECDGRRQVIVNDPFTVCKPISAYFDTYLDYPFVLSFITNRQTTTKKTVIESIYYINPKSKNVCTMCDATHKTNPVPESVLSNLKIGINKLTTTNSQSVQDYILSINKESQYDIVPVKRLSLNKIYQYYKFPTIDSSAFNGNMRFDKIYEGIESVDVIPKSSFTPNVSPPLLFRMTNSPEGYKNEKVTPNIPYEFEKIKSVASRVNASNYYLVESLFLDSDFFVFETPNGNFISKATRGEKYTLSDPIEESFFWKTNEKNIFRPIL